MGELSIRRDIELSAARYQKAAKAEKQAAAGKTGAAEQVTAKSPVSESLQKLVAKLDQMTAGLARADRRLLQTGESSLTEVRGSLERMTKLAEQAQDGSPEDRAALQEGLEKLSAEVDRLLQSASYNGVKLFGTAGEEAYTELATDMMALLSDMVDSAAGGQIPEGTELSTLMDAVCRLMEKMAGGATPDQALLELTDGGAASLLDLAGQLGGGQEELDLLSALFPGTGMAAAGPDGPGMEALLGGLEGYDLDLLLGLASARQSAGTEGTDPPQTGQFGAFQAEGQDLSGASFDAGSGVLTLSGDGEVTVQNAPAEDGAQARPASAPEAGGSVLLTGSGQVTIKDVKAEAMTVDTPQGKVNVEGQSRLDRLEMRSGTSVEFSGGGSLRLGEVRADRSNTMKVTGGAVTVGDGEGDLSHLGRVVVEGGALLAARASEVRGEDGEVKKPFDLALEKLIPNWKSITSLEVDGKAARMDQPTDRGEQVRAWLPQGTDSPNGSQIHTLAASGRDREEQIRTRFAYLRWNEATGHFDQIVRYPNPFVVTGGEQGVDWAYEEFSQTLRLLTDQVTAVSGGKGMDAESIPFSGRLAIEDNVGPVAVVLDGVTCTAAEGGALDLGRENEVTLYLPSEIENRFESGPGYAGIAVGDGTVLTIDMPPAGEEGEPEEDVWEGPDAAPEPPKDEDTDDGEEALPPGLLTAIGGDGGAGIGRNSGGTWDRIAKIVIRGGSVTAVGGGAGAGIGAGKHSFMGDIEIHGGIVSAEGGRLGGAGIGGALGGPVGDITLRGGEISAQAVYHAAAIGAGIEGECGTIRIGPEAHIVKAKGGDEGADIGACMFGKSGEVIWEDGREPEGPGAEQQGPADGIPLHVGEDTLTLPQLQLSSSTLLLSGLNVADWDSAWASKGVINAAMRRVERLREAYGELHDLGDEYGGAPRSMEEAAALLEGMRQDAGSGPVRHGQPEPDGVNRLLK